MRRQMRTEAERSRRTEVRCIPGLRIQTWGTWAVFHASGALKPVDARGIAGSERRRGRLRNVAKDAANAVLGKGSVSNVAAHSFRRPAVGAQHFEDLLAFQGVWRAEGEQILEVLRTQDRKSTRLNSSHMSISYAVF